MKKYLLLILFAGGASAISEDGDRSNLILGATILEAQPAQLAYFKALDDKAEVDDVFTTLISNPNLLPLP